MQLQNLGQPYVDNSKSDVVDMLTIVIPVRIDCEERRANLMTVIRHLQPLGCRVIVLEAHRTPMLDNEEWPGRTEYFYRNDTDTVFHRTKYINILLHMADTEAVAVWDTDVITDLRMVVEGVRLLSSGSTIIYPYNGEFVMLPRLFSEQVRKNPDLSDLDRRMLSPVFRRPFSGGIYMIHRVRYLGCGGENENFTGWGPEDAERLRRIRNLGHTAGWIGPGQAYHLWHPRGKNSWFADKEAEARLKMEMVKVSSMTKEQLLNYITSEQWNITTN